MRAASYAVSVVSISLAAACSGQVKDPSSGTPAGHLADSGTTGPSTGPGEASPASDDASMQPFAYFYGNAVDGGILYGVPAGGGLPVMLLAGDSTHDIADVVTFDAMNIYYSSEDSAAPTDGQPFSYSLHSLPISGGPPTTLASLLDRIAGIAVNATDVYFSVPMVSTLDDAGIATPHGEIHSVPIGGGPQKVLASMDADLHGIAVDSTYVYWTAGWSSSRAPGSGSVLKTPIAGGPTVTLTSGQLSPATVAVDATGVYWVDYGTMQVDCTSSDGSLWELATGSAVPVMLASSLHAPGSLAVNGADVYWAEAGASCNVPTAPGGSVSRRAGATGTTSSVATGIYDPANLSVGGSLLYFTKVTDTNNDILAPVATKL